MLNPYYLGSFDTNYIIFKNVENFKKNSKEIFFKQKYQNFKNILFVEMKIWKLIIIPQTCVEGEHIAKIWDQCCVVLWFFLETFKITKKKPQI
jgi:hypothetical protein